MKRLFCIALLFSLFWLGAAEIDATSEGDAVREAERASVIVENICEYSIKFKDTKRSPVKKIASMRGNGFFIKYPAKNGSSDEVMTARHVIACVTNIDSFLNEKLVMDDVSSWSLTSQIIFIRHENARYKATVANKSFNNDPTLDLAILEVAVGISHGSDPVLTDSDAIDKFKEVLVLGYMPWGVMRLKAARIEVIYQKEGMLQLNTPAYSGLSGSPILLLVDGVYHAIGVLVQKVQSEEEGVYDFSFAVLLKKEYFQ